MTDITDIALPQPSRIGQGTAIEQSRAVAEVYAAVMVARQVPRQTQTALRVMEEACRTPELAAKAFYSYPRGRDDNGKAVTVNGASIHLARELARCWGNIQYNVAELRRDDDHGQSEMLAYAWDLESNTRPSTIFIVPHKRDTKKGSQPLTDMRSIYESNANAGARRVRECIFAVLPIWFRERAENICRETLAKGGGKPMAERVANLLKWLETVNVTEQDAVRKVGRPSSEWTGVDLAELGIVLDSIKQGTVTRLEAFPPDLVTTEEITRQAAPAPAREVPAETEQRPTRESDVDAWHAAGHPGDTGVRSSWDPECPACDPGGRFHYYDHAEPEDGCVWCQRDAAYRTEDGQ